MADSYDPGNENEVYAEDDPGMDPNSEHHDQSDPQDLQTLMSGLDKLLKKYEATYYGDAMFRSKKQAYSTDVRIVTCRARRSSTTQASSSPGRYLQLMLPDPAP